MTKDELTELLNSYAGNCLSYCPEMDRFLDSTKNLKDALQMMVWDEGVL